MTGQPRLWTPALEAMNLAAHFDHPHGWTVQIRGRRQGDTWSDSPSEFYGDLTTPELHDVICAVSAQLLGL